VWVELEGTYTGADVEANWEALFRTMALFRRVAMEVGEGLGYAYPLDLDQQVVAYVKEMQRTR
jgi:aminoglycoside 6-adenylyltransferase